MIFKIMANYVEVASFFSFNLKRSRSDALDSFLHITLIPPILTYTMQVYLYRV